MNNRILTVASVATLLCITSGCGGAVRQFFFGRGASCGFCSGAPTQIAPPANLQPPPACGCQTPRDNCQTCVPNNGTPYAPVVSGYPAEGTVIGGDVIGNGVIYGDGGNWYQRPTDPYSSVQSYRVDKDGARIIHEDPLPPNTVATGG